MVDKRRAIISKGEDARRREAYAEGGTVPEMAARCGTPSWVYKEWMRRVGLKPYPRGRKKRQHAPAPDFVQDFFIALVAVSDKSREIRGRSLAWREISDVMDICRRTGDTGQGEHLKYYGR